MKKRPLKDFNPAQYLWRVGDTIKIVKPTGIFYDVIKSLSNQFIVTESEFVFSKISRLKQSGDVLDGKIYPMTKRDRVALHKHKLIKEINKTQLRSLSIRDLRDLRKFLRKQRIEATERMSRSKKA